MTFYLLCFLCGYGIGLCSAQLHLPLYVPVAAIVLVWFLAVIPVQ